MTNLLEIKNLSIDFHNRENACFHAVKHINLNLKNGEILGIVGESGSGKSVTALSVLGLLPYPKAEISTESSIKFHGKEMATLTDAELQHIRGNKISFIFQEPMSSLNPLHKIGRQIEESIMLHQKKSKQEARKMTLDLLKSVNIPQPEQKINAYPFELSGGQRQRVMIAMAIANSPEILIADEPTTALDVTVQEQIIDLLLHLKQQLNMSIIFISHNLRLVHKIADHIAVMHHGEIVEYGSAKQIFEDPQNSYTKKLISSNLSLNKKKNFRNEVALKAEKIEVKFPLKKNMWGNVVQYLYAVDQISLEIRQGETLGVVGESGSGKTTLAMAMVNLVKHKGKIYINNNMLFDEIKQFSKDVQIVFQDPYNALNPRMRIRDIVGEGLSVHFPKMTENERLHSIIDIIKAVELTEDILDKYPHEFSGGQRQRIALARALILKPKVLILDEPTSALDVTIQAQIIELLKKLQKQLRMSYIFISHDMAAVRAISDHVMVMKNGKIIEQGSVKQIFENPQDMYTKQLISASIL
ncbi:MAG: ABC transporter ATP-binding protein [Alphaproteobacteria bacterium]|nr:ABC transporter ATP-binding protein [Alphaproteobacteria bacterium]